jgi:hypothetical protein
VIALKSIECERCLKSVMCPIECLNEGIARMCCDESIELDD